MYATLLAGFCDFAAPMVLIVRVNISPIRGVMIKKWALVTQLGIMRNIW